jgi:hypothetical protein
MVKVMVICDKLFLAVAADQRYIKCWRTFDWTTAIKHLIVFPWQKLELCGWLGEMDRWWVCNRGSTNCELRERLDLVSRQLLHYEACEVRVAVHLDTPTNQSDCRDKGWAFFEGKL